MPEILIYNALVISPEVDGRGYVYVDGNGIIEAVGQGDAPAGLKDRAGRTCDAGGAYLMPGAIDVHVHFREPGLTRKATIATESRAAVAGGVTSYFDMPNTVPQTVTREAVEAKAEIAARDSMANYAFFIGATADNIDELTAADYSLIPGIKLFMGSSTGNMLLDDSNSLERLFAEAPAIISVHAEDEATIARQREAIISRYGKDAPVSLHTQLRPAEACVRATRRAVELARRHGTRLHIAHMTTADEIALLDTDTAPSQRLITSEVSPHHLLWTEDDYALKGARIKMNPSVKTAADRDALRKALADRRIDIVATDHAPHLPADKQGSLFEAASGAPMVQFSLIAMLELFDPSLVAEAMAMRPAEIFGVKDRGRIARGCHADLVLVERLDEPWTVEDSDVVSLCGWTPVAGRRFRHRVVSTWVNGRRAYDRGAFDESCRGERLRFSR